MHRYRTLVGDSLRPHIPEGVTQVLQPHFSVYTDTGELCRSVPDVSIEDMARPWRGLARVCYSYLITADRPGMTLRDHLQNFFGAPQPPGTRAYLHRVHELRGTSGKTCQLEIECAWFTPEPKQQERQEHPMEINEIGYYRTREGRQVRVICVDADKDAKNVFPVIALGHNGVVFCYTRDGSTRMLGDLHATDIVDKWVDKPVVPWQYMPAWAEYAAQDENGSWHWYVMRPDAKTCEWLTTTGADVAPFGRIPAKYAPAFYADWRNSLVRRPNDEPQI